MKTQSQIEINSDLTLFTATPALCCCHYAFQMLWWLSYHRYWPYLEKIADKLPELQPLTEMRPFLSVMHAKAHTGKCEVQWQVKCFLHKTVLNLLASLTYITLEILLSFYLFKHRNVSLHTHEIVWTICNPVMYLLSSLWEGDILNFKLLFCVPAMPVWQVRCVQ